MEDDELIELRKEVHKRTGWGDRFETEPSDATLGSWINGSPPPYTSDYLVKKLPNRIDDYKFHFEWNDDDTAHLEYRKENGESLCPVDGGTLQKGLLMLISELHKAGKLNS